MTEEYCISPISSMPRRLKAVLNAGGKNTYEQPYKRIVCQRE